MAKLSFKEMLFAPWR